MTVTVRDLRSDARADLEGFARVRHEALPFILLTPDSLAHDLTRMHPDAHYRPLVAVADGEVIGTAQVHLHHESSEPGQGNVNVYVHPEHTRRGAGTLLVRAAEEHLAAHGATRLFAWVLDEPGNRAFAERHAYRASRAAHFLRLDLANGTLPRSRTRRPAWNCARARTSPTTRARCSHWTRRRRRTNRAMGKRSSPTTRPGWRRPGGTRCSAPS